MKLKETRNPMKALRCLAAATALFGFAPEALADQNEPASLLIYPVHRSGGAFFTIVCVTNTNAQPQTPMSFGGGTNVHFQYFNVVANPANPFQPLNCVDFDTTQYLTPADTFCVLTGCHNATTAKGQEGYLVVKATNPALFNSPWSFNYLVGNEIVINASGATYGLNAVAVESEVGFQGNTDLNGNGYCDLDDDEYDDLSDELIIPSFVALIESQLCLVNLTGGPRDLNTVYLSIWNDMELPLSATLVFNCWFDQPLTAVSPAFQESFLSLLPNDPKELDIDCDNVGDLQTGWAVIDSIDVSTTGGLPVDDDGAMVGSITAGGASMLGTGDLLWGRGDQDNGRVKN
jgi:hypothetical protein